MTTTLNKAAGDRIIGELVRFKHNDNGSHKHWGRGRLQEAHEKYAIVMPLGGQHALRRDWCDVKLWQSQADPVSVAAVAAATGKAPPPPKAPPPKEPEPT